MVGTFKQEGRLETSQKALYTCKEGLKKEEADPEKMEVDSIKEDLKEI